MNAEQKKGAAGETGAPIQTTYHTPKNTNTSAQTQDGDVIDGIIAGQAAAEDFLIALRRNFLPPDALLNQIASMAPDRDRLKGFCRRLQKFIERAT